MVIGLFKNLALIHSITLPIGVNHITKDISKVCSLSLDESVVIRDNIDFSFQNNQNLFDENDYLKNIYLNYLDIKLSFRISLVDYFRILFPLMKKNCLYLFSFSTIITFGDFTIISFFKDQNFETLPSYLFRLISVYRFNEASFVAGFILLISLVIYFLIDNFSYQGKSAIKT